MAKNGSSCVSQSGDDVELRQGASGCDRGAPQAREVVAVGVGDALDQAEHAQAASWRESARRVQRARSGFEVGAAQAVDVELGTLQGAQQRLLGAGEEVQSLDGALTVVLRLGQPSEVALAAGGILQGREELQVAAVAAEQDLAQVDQAIDGLFQRRQFAGAVPVSGVPPCGGA